MVVRVPVALDRTLLILAIESADVGSVLSLCSAVEDAVETEVGVTRLDVVSCSSPPADSVDEGKSGLSDPLAVWVVTAALDLSVALAIAERIADTDEGSSEGT